MTVRFQRVRDQLRGWVPWWLQDRRLSSGKTVGFRFLWVMIAAFDSYASWILEGLLAAWPGKGTPSALPLIGRSRGIIRGQADTTATFAAKLRAWLDKWINAGTQRQLAIEIHEYLGNSPMVRIVNRAGHWVTVAQDGTVTTAQVNLNWDSVSNPEFAGYWSELWIFVYPSQWSIAGSYGDGETWGAGDGFGFGHQVSRVEVDAIKGLIAQWKAAHSRVRAIVWTTDATLFNPAVPLSLPDGTWGLYGTTGSAARVVGSRNQTTCRYWEL